MSISAIALNRFGLGARPDEDAPGNGKAWLEHQLADYDPAPAAWAALPGSTALADAFNRQQAAIHAAPDENAKQPVRMALNLATRDAYRAAVNARATAALATRAPFVERLVHFWSNHFAVSGEKPEVTTFAGSFEAEAIRPHVLGRFEDLLTAVERHPAMQFYLDQTRSIGPNSPLATRVAARNPAKRPGLNENLAREIMELHTLGVRTGYSQADVTEFARALTGWGLNGMGAGSAGHGVAGPTASFVFRPQLHEPGTRRIIGRAYPQSGEDQPLAVLHDLAASPATANHLATKLVRHFVADDPPPAMVKRVAAAFTASRGDLPAVYRAMVASPEAWHPQPAKFKTPWEWMISSMRGLGLNDPGNMQMAPLLLQLGQQIWRPGSPAGFDDVAASWAAPDALLRRVEMAQRLCARIGDRVDPRTLGDLILPDGALTDATRQAVSRAESAAVGLALLLVSPEFQRR